MSLKRVSGYPLTTLLCLLMLYLSPLPLTLAQSCPKQCSCFEEMIQCLSPDFPVILPSQNISSFHITGSFHTLPRNAVVQPEACNITNVIITSSTISDVKPYCLSGLKAGAVELILLKIVKLQPKAFAGITCKRFLITSSTINVLQFSSFHGLNSEELIISSSSFPLVSLKHSHQMTVNSINISKCYICELDTDFPIGNQSVTISWNKIQSFYQNATIGGLFFENQIFCSCNLTSGWFKNELYKKYLFNNTCLGPSKLEGLPLIDLKESEVCNQTENLTVQCDIHITPTNSAFKFFKFNQTLILFLAFVLNAAYRL